MENATYRVNVTSPGLTVFFRNRNNRTPVVFMTVYTSELDVLELQFKQKSIQYTVDKNTPSENTEGESSGEDIKQNDEVKVEELYIKEKKEPGSILDKLIAEDK